MINTKENINDEVENSSVKYFKSLKNKCSFPYETEAVRHLMLLTERDESADNYDHFILTRFAADNLNEVESCPGLIIESDGCFKFIVISDRLASDSQLADKLKEQLETVYPPPIQLEIRKIDSFKNNLLTDSLEFLYEFAVLPSDHNAFNAIREFLDFASEASIGQLKLRIKNAAAIYQLLFHRALRADLENDPISDDTIVNASPIIKSIVKTL